MPEFDAELYLRLAGERALLDAGASGHGWSPPNLGAAADALRAVGAIAPEAAEAVVEDYNLALALRHEAFVHHHLFAHAARQAGAADPERLRPRRVVPCDHVIEQPGGTLHIRSVSLGDDSTRLAVVFRPPISGSRRRGATMMLGSWSGGLPQVTLVDDRGTKAFGDFSGGGSEHEWHGHFEADRPLAKDTAWIEVDGERVELVDEPLPIDVRVEALPEGDPALRYLWLKAASGDRFGSGADALEAAIDALVAAGAVSADEPELDDVRTVTAAVQHAPAPARRMRRLPEPWRSLFARRRRANGPSGVIGIGVVTPVFDGTSVAVGALESSQEEFVLDVEVTPGLRTHSPFDTGDEHATVAWWAADDRGNQYLGQMTSWSGGDDYCEGTVAFWPALDPEATRLDLMPTGETSRCVIGVPLQWSERRPDG